MRKQQDDDFEAEIEGLLGSDVYLSLAGFFLFLFIVLLILPKNPAMENEGEAPVVGNVCFDIKWDDERDVDVDLWVKGPDDVVVGYSSMNGPLMNLMRDDLGAHMDISGTNQELTCSRGIVQGKYLANAFWFSNAENSSTPIDVDLYVLIKKDGGKAYQREEIRMKVSLPKHRAEATLVEFELDSDMRIIPESINQVFQPLYATNRQEATFDEPS